MQSLEKGKSFSPVFFRFSESKSGAGFISIAGHQTVFRKILKSKFFYRKERQFFVSFVIFCSKSVFSFSAFQLFLKIRANSCNSCLPSGLWFLVPNFSFQNFSFQLFPLILVLQHLAFSLQPYFKCHGDISPFLGMC